MRRNALPYALRSMNRSKSNNMKDDNTNKYPEIHKWEFWKETKHGIEKYENMVALRITPSNKLAVRFVDAYQHPKIFYVPFEYWCGSDAPLWKITPNKNYGFYIRPKLIPLNEREQLALIQYVSNCN